MKLLWKQLTLLFLEQYLRYGANQNDQMKPEFIFVENHLDDSDVSDGSFWERMKAIEDQGVIINRQFLPNV